MIELRPLTLADMQTVRVWRHQFRETLRTPYMLTDEMQEQYYRDVICNRHSRTRYWGLWTDRSMTVQLANQFVGYGGLENISWENGNAEISLLIGPGYQRSGYGREAVVLFLREAFDRMRLNMVYAECYGCGPWRFWWKLAGGEDAYLPHRKFWDGKLYGSYIFHFYRSDYERLKNDSDCTGEGEEHKDPTEKRAGVFGCACGGDDAQCSRKAALRQGCGIE